MCLGPGAAALKSGNGEMCGSQVTHLFKGFSSHVVGQIERLEGCFGFFVVLSIFKAYFSLSLPHVCGSDGSS